MLSNSSTCTRDESIRDERSNGPMNSTLLSSHCGHRSIPMNDMRPCLKRLNLSWNEISDWPPSQDLLSTFRSLEVIDVSFNQLKEIKMDIFALPNLRSLYAQGNMIEVLPDCWDGCRLAVIDLRDNLLSSLPHGIFQVRSLIACRLSGNPLAKASVEPLKRFIDYNKEAVSVHRISSNPVLSASPAQQDGHMMIASPGSNFITVATEDDCLEVNLSDTPMRSTAHDLELSNPVTRPKDTLITDEVDEVELFTSSMPDDELKTYVPETSQANLGNTESQQSEVSGRRVGGDVASASPLRALSISESKSANSAAAPLPYNAISFPKGATLGHSSSDFNQTVVQGEKVSSGANSRVNAISSHTIASVSEKTTGLPNPFATPAPTNLFSFNSQPNPFSQKDATKSAEPTKPSTTEVPNSFAAPASTNLFSFNSQPNPFSQKDATKSAEPTKPSNDNISNPFAALAPINLFSFSSQPNPLAQIVAAKSAEPTKSNTTEVPNPFAALAPTNLFSFNSQPNPFAQKDATKPAEPTKPSNDNISNPFDASASAQTLTVADNTNTSAGTHNMFSPAAPHAFVFGAPSLYSRSSRPQNKSNNRNVGQ
eukprot:TRINITY_DN7696_c0_g1_i7.p1 TRINITY_DN7696_c0_g1~~TRINITY_DN7696_c0_g1_i7.p1  ORF type:complete len:597 (-),score=94.40 TRINITY_DN7696_c0_g1_i7:1683-3473(-)